MNCTMNFCTVQPTAPASALPCGTRDVRRAPRDWRIRLAAYAVAALTLAVMAYGERWVLEDAPTPLVESTLARCAAGLVDGRYGSIPACAPEAPALPGDTAL